MPTVHVSCITYPDRYNTVLKLGLSSCWNATPASSCTTRGQELHTLNAPNRYQGACIPVSPANTVTLDACAGSIHLCPGPLGSRSAPASAICPSPRSPLNRSTEPPRRRPPWSMMNAQWQLLFQRIPESRLRCPTRNHIGYSETQSTRTRARPYMYDTRTRATHDHVLVPLLGYSLIHAMPYCVYSMTMTNDNDNFIYSNIRAPRATRGIRVYACIRVAHARRRMAHLHGRRIAT